MAEPRRIKAPSPRVLPDRVVEVPPTIGDRDTDEPLPPLGKTRSDFREQEFTRVLNQHGKYVIWRKAVLCPCLNENTGQASLDCMDCDGSSYLYIDPVDIRAHMAQFDKSTKIYEKFGLWQQGGVSITVEPKYRLGYRDSIEMKDALMSFNELLKKNNRRGIRSKLPGGVDSARYRITNLTKALYRDVTSGLIVPLENGTHYRITKDGWIEWTASGNAQVPQGTFISVHYDFHPVFLIESWPHATRDDVSRRKTAMDRVVSLPLQAMGKLDFLTDVNAPVTGAV